MTVINKLLKAANVSKYKRAIAKGQGARSTRDTHWSLDR